MGETDLNLLPGNPLPPKKWKMATHWSLLILSCLSIIIIYPIYSKPQPPIENPATIPFTYDVTGTRVFDSSQIPILIQISDTDNFKSRNHIKAMQKVAQLKFTIFGSISIDSDHFRVEKEINQWNVDNISLQTFLGKIAMFYELVHSDLSKAIILTDNVVVSSSFQSKLPDILDHFDEEELDILLLGYDHEDLVDEGFSLIPNGTSSTCFGYVLSIKAALNLISNCERSYQSPMIDQVLQDLIQEGKLKGERVSPPLVKALLND